MVYEKVDRVIEFPLLNIGEEFFQYQITYWDKKGFAVDFQYLFKPTTLITRSVWRNYKKPKNHCDKLYIDRFGNEICYTLDEICPRKGIEKLLFWLVPVKVNLDLTGKKYTFSEVVNFVERHEEFQLNLAKSLETTWKGQRIRDMENVNSIEDIFRDYLKIIE